MEQEKELNQLLLRAPAWRSRLLEITLSSDEPFTAEAMSRRLTEEGYPIGRAATTVFMRQLAEEHVLREAQQRKRGGRLLLFSRNVTLPEYWDQRRKQLTQYHHILGAMMEAGDKKYLEKEAA